MRVNTKYTLVAVVFSLLIISASVVSATSHEWDYKNKKSDLLTNDMPNPQGYEIGDDGKIYFLSDSSATEEVYVYNATGSYTGTKYDISTQVESGGDIAQNATGYWFIYDYSLNEILVYDSTFTYSHSETIKGSQKSHLTQADNGRWFVLLQNDNKVLEYSSDFTTHYGNHSLSDSSGYTTGIEQGANGNWFITDWSNGEVDKYDSSYTYSKSYNVSSEDSEPWSVDQFSDGEWTIYGSANEHIYFYNGDAKSTVSGQITDSNGNGLDSADVKIEDSSGAVVYDNFTNSTGHYSTELEDGDYTLIANKDGYYQDSITFSVSGMDMNVDLSLSAKPKVTGTIVDTKGEAVDNGTIQLLQNSTVKYETSTNSTGGFSMSVDKGNYTLEFTKDTYYTHNQSIEVQNDTNLGDIEVEAKDYELILRVSPYMNHSDTQDYVVRFNDNVITENATITVSNTSLIYVDNQTLTLNATDNTNISGEVNVTATYVIDNQTLTHSQNVTVSPMEMGYIEILPPLYSTLTIVTDKSIQFLVLAVVAGVGIATVTNAFGGIGLMIISLIMGWIMDYIPLGVLLASLFGGIFIMLNTRMQQYK